MFGLSFSNGVHFTALWDAKLVSALKEYTVLPLLMAVACMPIVPWLKTWFGKNVKRKAVGNTLGTVAATALLVLSLVFLIGQTYNPFIYFRF